MSTEAAELARLGAALANETRSAILCALMSGTAHTNTELCRFIGAAPSSISEHVATLADAGLVSIHPQGRHRYVRLATPSVAALLEQLGVIASSTPVRPKVPTPLLTARTCYRHLAGRLGVAVHDAFLANGLATSGDAGLMLSADGQQRFEALGLKLDADRHTAEKHPATKHPATKHPADKLTADRLRLRSCMDWTERRPHLAGRPVEALLDHAFAVGWVRRHRSHPRAIELTSIGRTAFTHDLGIELP